MTRGYTTSGRPASQVRGEGKGSGLASVSSMGRGVWKEPEECKMTYRLLIAYVHVRNRILKRYAWRRAAAHPFVRYLLQMVLRAEDMEGQVYRKE